MQSIHYQCSSFGLVHPKYLVHVSSLAPPRLNHNSCHLALNFCVHACEIANLEQIRSPHRQKPAFPAGNGLDRPKFSPYRHTNSSGRAPGDGPGTAKVTYPLERKGQIHVPFCARDIGPVSQISDLCPGYVNRFKFWNMCWLITAKRCMYRTYSGSETVLCIRDH